MFEVNIDFDKAQNAWRANKKQIEPGVFCYRCIAKYKSGKNVNKKCINIAKYDKFCYLHRKNQIKNT